MGKVYNLIGPSTGATATIIVNAPTGGTITLTTPSGVVLTTTEVSGTWTFSGLFQFGTYVVSASNGVITVTEDVLVDAATEFVVDIEYVLTLYDDGNERTSVTGGWVAQDYYGSASMGTLSKGTNTLNYTQAANLNLGSAAYHKKGWRTSNTIDLTNFTELVFIFANNFTVYGRNSTYQSYLYGTTLSSYTDSGTGGGVPSGTTNYMTFASYNTTINANTEYIVPLTNKTSSYISLVHTAYRYTGNSFTTQISKVLLRP